MPEPSDHVTWHTVFEGKKLTLALKTIALADGTMAQREVVLHPGAVAVIPLVDRDHVVLIRNRRHTVGQTLIELPAGTLDPGEEPDICAARELREETGYQAGQLRRLTEFYSSPGITNERLFLYEATDLQPGPLDLQGDEQIEPFIVPWSQAIAMCRDGQIDDAKTLVGLLFLEMERNGG